MAPRRSDAQRMPDIDHSERRVHQRKKLHLFCQLTCAGRSHPAVVLDISTSGLFVRTAAAPPLGTQVEVTIRLAGGQAWALVAEVAREPQAETALDAIQARGLGLKILNPPSGFAEFVTKL
jgi:PilZ domain